ncbi:MAG: hypothetical protein NTX15_08390 [Candidatus Kapabacteria bacterium]|nr:hypothetical protein [Candidatus Kapabacteria bacterium]
MIPEHAVFLSGDAVVSLVESVMERLEGAGGGATPVLVESLRRSLGSAEMVPVPLLIDLALGTLRAERLGKRERGWLFTERMAEQCTHPVIASHHAQAFIGCNHVLEICTGAGIDTAALSRTVPYVTTLESDSTIVEVTRGNLRRSEIRNVTVVASAWPVEALTDLEAFDGVWADPSRRTERGRKRSGTDYQPPLASIPHANVVGIKVGPGDSIEPSGFVSEYIGFGKECRERVLWKSEHMTVHTVSLIDKKVSWSRSSEVSPLIVPTAAYLIEPHNAIIASGDVGTFFAEIGAGVFDAMIAYGALNEEPPASPWYKRYKVAKIDQGVSVRRIQESIRELGWGSTTIFKKRGWENDPEDLRRALSFASGGPPGVVIVMRVGNGHQTVYATSVASRESL